jgi:small subunit ribosomal protein S21
VAEKRFYEKPTKKRERLAYEKCRRLYDREMKRKVEFVMKQNDPLPPI